MMSQLEDTTADTSPEVEGGEAGEGVDHGRDVDQAVVAAVQHTQVLQTRQLLGQTRHHVLNIRANIRTHQNISDIL